MSLDRDIEFGMQNRAKRACPYGHTDIYRRPYKLVGPCGSLVVDGGLGHGLVRTRVWMKKGQK